jgi:hypothetical protein
MDFLAKLLLLCSQASAGYYQRLLVGESGIIRTQTETHNRQIVAMHGTPCAIPPRNSHSTH